MTTDCYCFLYCHSVENRQVQVRACQQLCGIQLSTIGQVGQLAMTCGQAAPTLHPLPFTHIFWPPHIQVIYAYGILLTISSFRTATCCVSSVCMPTCNVSCWGSHTPDTLLKMSHKFHGCVFYHWRMSACFSYQNGSEHLDDLIDLSFCCLVMLCLRNFVTLSLRHLPKCLCNLTQSWVLLAPHDKAKTEWWIYHVITHVHTRIVDEVWRGVLRLRYELQRRTQMSELNASPFYSGSCRCGKIWQVLPQQCVRLMSSLKNDRGN